MELTFDPEKHVYKLNGKRLTSVTTVLGAGIPKPQLVPWAARTVAEWALENPADMERLAHEHAMDLANENVDAKGRTAALNYVSRKADEKRDKAAKRGTKIHAIAERIIHGEAVDVPEELVSVIDGYIRFLDEFEVTAILTEKTILLAELGVAGRFDLIATSPYLNHGDPFIADTKSSGGVYESTAAQLAAYASADGHVTDDDPTTLHPLPKVTASYVLHCTPDEGTRVIPFAQGPEELAADFDYFLAAYDIYERTLARHKVKDPIPYPAHTQAA